MVTYGWAGWWDKELQLLPEQNCLKFSGFRSSPSVGQCPPHAMEIMLDLTHLHFLLEWVARMVSYRLMTVGSQYKEELRWYKTGLLSEINDHHILGMVLDSLTLIAHIKIIQRYHSRQSRIEYIKEHSPLPD